MRATAARLNQFETNLREPSFVKTYSFFPETHAEPPEEFAVPNSVTTAKPQGRATAEWVAAHHRSISAPKLPNFTHGEKDDSTACQTLAKNLDLIEFELSQLFEAVGK